MTKLSERKIMPSDLKGFVSVEKALDGYIKKLRTVGKDIKRPENQKLREQFQAVMLTLGICKLHQKRWHVRMTEIENDPTDFEAVTINTDARTFDFVKVQNMMIPKECAGITGQFSESGIAQFIFDKKLSRVLRGDYSKEYIFGCYLNFRKQSLHFEKLAEELKKDFQDQMKYGFMVKCRLSLKNGMWQRFTHLLPIQLHSK